MTSKIKVDNITDQDDNNIINESGDVITVGAAGDTVAVAGNIVKSNALQASDGGNIVNQSGTTITIGASGDTVSLASGASQSGFGRSGSVDWQTGSIKTGTFTAASGEGYFADTSSSAFSMNLPAGTAGAIVAVADYTRTFNTNNLTIVPNGSQKIGGQAFNVILQVNGQALTLVYVDDTEGWINVQNAEDTETGLPLFITATGGTETTSGDFKIHTFTGPGTFAISHIAPSPSGNPNAMDYNVVAGGGAGGGPRGGGGGAGGMRFSAATYCGPAAKESGSLTATAASFPITVGAGGTGGSPNGSNGSNSIFSTITSTGGGGGRDSAGNASSGGSGGAGGANDSAESDGGAGNNPPVSPDQGQSGGDGVAGSQQGASGGGGGKIGGGSNGGHGGSPGGNGGAGLAISITGSPVAYAGGGGGGKDNRASGGNGGSGGTGGGGDGGAGSSGNPPVPGSAGTANTGGGGGGTGQGPFYEPFDGYNGGSGIVIIRYKYQ